MVTSTRIQVDSPDGEPLGHVATTQIEGVTRWKSWRMDDGDPYTGPVGVHQDRAQAEAFLAQLAARHTSHP